ncbi:MAG: PKD domain-containing protein, partial [Bacteroidota bacterium]
TNTVQSVICPATNIDFGAADLGGYNWQFTDLSNSSIPITGWNWTFGDGAGSFLQNPIHLYPAAGDYTVCLEVVTACSRDTFCEEITVLDPSNVDDALLEAIDLVPNPNSGLFRLFSTGAIRENIDLRITDLQGKVQYHTQLQGLDAGGTSVSLPTLAAGIYLLDLSSEQGRKVIRLEIVR